MKNLIFFLQKTVGQKAVVGLTGLGLCAFVLIHMLGNLFLFQGAEAYNTYAYKLHDFVLMGLFEIGLLTFFVGHILLAVLLNIKNRKAKPESYQKQASGLKKTSLLDRTVLQQGAILLVFILWHVLTFEFSEVQDVTYGDIQMPNVYLLTLQVFQNPLALLAYIVGFFILLLHVVRGFSASFRSLGFYHPRYTSGLEITSWLFGSLVCLGFFLQALYVFWFL